jgi:hypothetical protein
MPDEHRRRHRKVLGVASLDAREHREVEVEKVARQFTLQEQQVLLRSTFRPAKVVDQE